MQKGTIKIKIISTIEGEETELSVGELGVLLTAINRCFNESPFNEDSIYSVKPLYRYNSMNYEPALVSLKIVSIRNGCIELDLFADVLKFINDIQEPHRALILGALGSGMWDISKTFAKHFSRATKRIAIASAGKVITIAFTVNGKTSKFMATVGMNRDVTIKSEDSSPDE